MKNNEVHEYYQRQISEPEAVSVIPTALQRILQRRSTSLNEGEKVDWSLAETLAFATILADGKPIRISGQDAERATFAHRNLVLHDSENGAKFCPLHNLPQARASFAIYNSPLSEESVVGFEYGYNVYSPDTLVIWEAQFGDFANCAQVIFDQFVSAGRAKWSQKSSLVMLLPHANEGQGPEHTSARLERFLQLCAEDNMTVANLSSASQYFHLLRRQASLTETEDARPLVMMSPKSLIRNPRVASPATEFSEGKFEPVLEQAGLGTKPDRVERIILCSGKIAIDLEDAFEKDKADWSWLHIIRVEQLYPFPAEEIKRVLARFSKLKELGDVLLELETDKVNIEISAEESGVLEKIIRQEGETVEIGETIGTLSAGAGGGSGASASQPAASEQKQAAPAPEAPTPPPAPVAAAPESSDSSSKTASPSARKLARERGIELDQVQSKDPIGRVYQDDVKTHSTQAAAPSAPPAKAPAAAPSAPAAGGSTFTKPMERQRMSRRRATIAKRLVEAQQTAAMLTTFNEVDMTAIMDVRKRRKDKFKEKHEINLGFMSFFTKAVVGALKKFPTINAEIDGEDVVLKKYYDIGIAVSAKEGLVVPVVRDADRLGFAEIEKSIADLASKARSNTLALSDLQGGTFTITNGGTFGSLLSTPILNTPQVGILGMHKIQLRPVAIDAERMENRPMMYIALSYDHRIIDGSEAVRFLVTVKELLEDPESLLIEGHMPFKPLHDMLGYLSPVRLVQHFVASTWIKAVFDIFELKLPILGDQVKHSFTMKSNWILFAREEKEGHIRVFFGGNFAQIHHITRHPAESIGAGITQQIRVFYRFAMSTMIIRVHSVAVRGELLGKFSISGSGFAHAMCNLDYTFNVALRIGKPAVHMNTGTFIANQAKGRFLHLV
ncbi:hypothetical protein G195_001929 [Phytophthora kernoviae 00238/432]|uniref:Peripheral subunit-binding (PSBD) domain-containing protein n=1 Tax=Phytophthora kernoviae 00238/432 TaxID=1284355 RepID=A0A8J4SSL8_9STRA|nr:hypothetical protein G195_001929 [Phytophthora kernoviae 00238/432]